MNSRCSVTASNSSNSSFVSSKRKRGSSCSDDVVQDDVVATTTSPSKNDIIHLNNLGVDCFEHGVITDATKCFQNAMEIFSSQSSGSTVPVGAPPVSRQVSLESCSSTRPSPSHKDPLATSEEKEAAMIYDTESVASDAEVP